MKQLARRLLGVFMAMMMLLTALPSAFALESDIKGIWLAMGEGITRRMAL